MFVLPLWSYQTILFLSFSATNSHPLCNVSFYRPLTYHLHLRLLLHLLTTYDTHQADVSDGVNQNKKLTLRLKSFCKYISAKIQNISIVNCFAMLILYSSKIKFSFFYIKLLYNNLLSSLTSVCRYWLFTYIIITKNKIQRKPFGLRSTCLE